MRLGCGVIGAGAIADIVHLPAYKTMPQTKLVAVCDIDEKRAKNMAKKFGAEMWFTDYRKLLERDDIEAVSICTPNFLHRKHAVAAASAGKHILLEKPMAPTLKECDEIISACKKADVKLMIGVNSRFEPVNQRVKKLLDEGVIGKIFQIRYHAAYAGPYEFWPAISEWFFDTSKVGGGCLMDTGVHFIDLLRWFLGDISNVCAIGGNIMGNIKGEDNAMVLLSFKAGALGELDVSWTYSLRAKKYDLRAEILGTDGGIFIKGPPSPITIYTESKIQKMLMGSVSLDIPTTPAEIMAFQKRKIEHFIKSVLEDKEPLVTGEDGKAAVEVVLAAYESMKTGRKVNLPLL
ncbi:MAG: Gfo/Idh/MocA family oxidoreductase [Candidatus Bathyarchaeota archaeon]|nr:Gfo/Idh/MocA family oxidoreductase [Candidatus Bathyarchaeota archaeon]